MNNFLITGKLIYKSKIINIKEGLNKRFFLIELIQLVNGQAEKFNFYFETQNNECINLLKSIDLDKEISIHFNIICIEFINNFNISYLTNLESWKIDSENKEVNRKNEFFVKGIFKKKFEVAPLRNLDANKKNFLIKVDESNKDVIKNGILLFETWNDKMLLLDNIQEENEVSINFSIRTNENTHYNTTIYYTNLVTMNVNEIKKNII